MRKKAFLIGLVSFLIPILLFAKGNVNTKKAQKKLPIPKPAGLTINKTTEKEFLKKYKYMNCSVEKNSFAIKYTCENDFGIDAEAGVFIFDGKSKILKSVSFLYPFSFGKTTGKILKILIKKYAFLKKNVDASVEDFFFATGDDKVEIILEVNIGQFIVVLVYGDKEFLRKYIKHETEKNLKLKERKESRF